MTELAVSNLDKGLANGRDHDPRICRRASARTREVAAVNDLDLEIKDNSFVTLLGPSGCGKTTTLRLIAGYIVPDRGTIEVDGRRVSSPGAVVPPEARGMGMVFQNYAVWPHKTVFENVVFGLKLRKVPAAEAKQKVEETLALVNLGGLENRYPNELSGGQQQRVALARSLVVEPGILLLDEPLSNLDAKLRERMRTELKELQRRTGITFVYVTHDQAEALALSDQIAVMNAGRLQQFGTPLRGLCAIPPNRMVADFMGLVNLVPGEVRAVRNGGGTVSVGDLHARRRRARRPGGGRQRRCGDPAGEYHACAPRGRRAGQRRQDHQPRLPRQYQRILRDAAVRPDAAGADPSARAVRGRRRRWRSRSTRRNAASSAAPAGDKPAAVIAVKTGACRPALPWRG